MNDELQPGECPQCGGFPPCECWDICACGDNRSEHDPITGKSMYNFECHGFEYDEEATLLALATAPEVP